MWVTKCLTLSHVLKYQQMSFSKIPNANCGGGMSRHHPWGWFYKYMLIDNQQGDFLLSDCCFDDRSDFKLSERNSHRFLQTTKPNQIICQVSILLFWIQKKKWQVTVEPQTMQRRSLYPCLIRISSMKRLSMHPLRCCLNKGYDLCPDPL